MFVSQTSSFESPRPFTKSVNISKVYYPIKAVIPKLNKHILLTLCEVIQPNPKLSENMHLQDLLMI